MSKIRDDWRQYGRRAGKPTPIWPAFERVMFELGCLRWVEVKYPTRRDQIDDRAIVAWALRHMGCSRSDVATAVGLTEHGVHAACVRVDGWMDRRALRAHGVLSRL